MGNATTKMNSPPVFQTPGSPRPSTPIKFKLTHVRTGGEDADSRYVSCQDALEYMQPWLERSVIDERIAKLPRAVQIRAVWPPATDKAQHAWDDQNQKKQLFVAIQVSNLQMLLIGQGDNGDIQKEAIVRCIHDFASELELTLLNGVPVTNMIVVNDAKKTQSQLRYERDIRDRVTNPDKYYMNKRRRDRNFRQRQKSRTAS